MPAPSRDEDFTANKGSFQYLLVKIQGKVEFKLPLILKSDTSLSCHPEGTTASNYNTTFFQQFFTMDSPQKLEKSSGRS